MDKLQWFKFSYADWRMGKIQRCSDTVQARFMNLCCLYWSKECLLSYEDAEIEIDKENLDILIAKKIVTNNDDFINISFLDEQYIEIEEKTKGRSVSGILGNLKRWKPTIYKRYENKEITLDEAINLSKEVAKVSLPDSDPIATQSQNIAEKRREEEIRGDDNVSDDIDFVYSFYPTKCPVKNSSTGKSSKSNKAKIKILLKDYTKEDLKYIIDRYLKECVQSKTYIKNFSTFLNNLPDYSEDKNNASKYLKPLHRDAAIVILKMPEQVQKYLDKGYTLEDLKRYAKEGELSC